MELLVAVCHDDIIVGTWHYHNTSGGRSLCAPAGLYCRHSPTLLLQLLVAGG